MFVWNTTGRGDSPFKEWSYFRQWIFCSSLFAMIGAVYQWRSHQLSGILIEYNPKCSLHGQRLMFDSISLVSSRLVMKGKMQIKWVTISQAAYKINFEFQVVMKAELAMVGVIMFSLNQIVTLCARMSQQILLWYPNLTDPTSYWFFLIQKSSLSFWNVGCPNLLVFFGN